MNDLAISSASACLLFLFLPSFYFLSPKWFGVGGWWLDIHNLRNDIHVTAMGVNISCFSSLDICGLVTSQDVFIGFGLWCFSVYFDYLSRGLGIFISFLYIHLACILPFDIR
jgi:hypothetical protein